MRAAIHDLRTLFDIGVVGRRSDGELLDRFVERREDAVFEAIAYRHGPMVWGVCRRVLRDHHDAEDAFQATFLVLARKASSVVPSEKLGNWLYGVAYQTAMKARATRARRRGRESQVSMMPECEAAAPNLQDDLAAVLDRELSCLPENYRIPIVLCDLEGRAHKEAASQLGWPIGTVSSRLARARSMLAKRLRRRGVSLSVGSLALLLAQESARAGMPVRLIGSTAQAARQLAAGIAVAAGVVPAGVAILTREVLKVMLFSKLKIVTVVLLAVSALAASGASLGYRARTSEPNQKEELQRLIDEKKGELERLVDRQKGEGQRTKGQAQQVQSNLLAPTTDDQRSGYPLSDLFLAGAHTAQQLDHAKSLIEEMLVFEKESEGKSPEELDAMIEATYWEARLSEFRLRRLKQIRDATRESNRPR